MKFAETYVLDEAELAELEDAGLTAMMKALAEPSEDAETSADGDEPR